MDDTCPVCGGPASVDDLVESDMCGRCAFVDATGVELDTYNED